MIEGCGRRDGRGSSVQHAMMASTQKSVKDIDSTYAWMRLVVSLMLMTIGCSGMYSMPVVRPRIQEDFGVARADASQWFDRHRGIALAICMSGNYTVGALWPPVMQYFIDSVG